MAMASKAAATTTPAAMTTPELAEMQLGLQ
jgi:hypothetical protein